jgi:hypothetical protein
MDFTQNTASTGSFYSRNESTATFDTISEFTSGNGVTLGSLLYGTKTNAITAYATGGQTNATPLTTNINRITTCATDHDSVKLPIATAGLMSIKVINSGASSLDVYPKSGDNFEGLAANVPITIPTGRESIFDCAVTGTWSEKRPAPIPTKYTTGTTTGTFTTGQLTGANYVIYGSTATTPGSIATRTATQMFQDDPQARVGGSYVLRIINTNGSSNAMTITSTTGVTLNGTMSIAANAYRDFIVTYNSATTLTIQAIS